MRGAVAAGSGAARPRRERAALLAGDRSRFAAGVAPVTVVYLLALWQASSGAISLADVLSFLGVVTVALLAGVFPVLLVVAARRKGELPAGDYRLPVARWLLWTVYAITLGGVALHGLVLWEDPVRRLSALFVTVVALAITASMLRNGTFARRATIELCHDGIDDSARFSIVASGRPAAADVVLEYADGEQRLRGATGEIPAISTLRRAVFAADWKGADPRLRLAEGPGAPRHRGGRVRAAGRARRDRRRRPRRDPSSWTPRVRPCASCRRAASPWPSSRGADRGDDLVERPGELAVERLQALGLSRPQPGEALGLLRDGGQSLRPDRARSALDAVREPARGVELV